VTGYQLQHDSYVMLEDEELEAVALESTRTIDIERFVPAADIGWIWLDRPHFLKPGDKVGEEAFVVIREAMAAGTGACRGLFSTAGNMRWRFCRATWASSSGPCATPTRFARPNRRPPRLIRR